MKIRQRVIVTCDARDRTASSRGMRSDPIILCEGNGKTASVPPPKASDSDARAMAEVH